MITFNKSQESLIITAKGNVVFDLLINFCAFLFFMLVVLVSPLWLILLIYVLNGDVLNCRRISAELIECQINQGRINEQTSIQLKHSTVVKEAITHNETTKEGFQVKLLTIDNEMLNFSYLKDSKSEAEQISQKINNFISDSNQASLKIKQAEEPFTVISVCFCVFLLFIPFTVFSVYKIKYFFFKSCKKTWDFDIEKRLLVITNIYWYRAKQQKYSLSSLNYQEIFTKSDVHNLNIKLIKEDGDDILLEFESYLPVVKQLSELIDELFNVQLQKISLFTSPKNIHWFFNLNQGTLTIHQRSLVKKHSFYDINLLIEPLLGYNDDNSSFVKYYCLYLTVLSSSEKLMLTASTNTQELKNYRLLLNNILKL